MRKMTVEDFAALTASKEPAPGGGSVSALAGALAAALTEMVAGLTEGKKKYAGVQEKMLQAIPVMQDAREMLLDNILKDSRSFDGYMEALGLPKETEEEKAARGKAMEDALKEAVKVPLATAREAARILPYAELMVTQGNASAVTDGLVAAMMARTAVLGALYNVKINLRSIKDTAFTEAVSGEVRELEARTTAMERRILASSGL